MWEGQDALWEGGEEEEGREEERKREEEGQREGEREGERGTGRERMGVGVGEWGMRGHSHHKCPGTTKATSALSFYYLSYMMTAGLWFTKRSFRSFRRSQRSTDF